MKATEPISWLFGNVYGELVFLPRIKEFDYVSRTPGPDRR